MRYAFVRIHFAVEPSITVDEESEKLAATDAGLDPVNPPFALRVSIEGIGDETVVMSQKDGKVDPVSFVRSMQYILNSLSEQALRKMVVGVEVSELSEELIQEAIAAAAGNKNAN